MATEGDGTTARGSATRARIIAATAGLLTAGGSTDVTVSGIARAAGVYPNQITHHFGSKDRLVLDAAFTLFLRDTSRMQAAGRRVGSPGAFRTLLARTTLAMPSLPLVVAALGVGGRERSAHLLGLLFRQSERYLARVAADRGWASRSLHRDVRTFWSAAFGAALLRAAGGTGGPEDVDLAATLSISAGPADAP
ncbi:TetR/AcrR family transcriptional regulator C-terminal domain-containing protein [Curtobacterium sp. 458]|uniref:TetR/AcrR family transcriptional regulator C-terminal domain-containing protein n=1 Tax=Curtobacterium sp. 458 TaxID=3050069 RepID=UPI0025B401EB|nr:TetR/AcrR family transcriptional regulator C-terminal domain-containing protein [Curtobacterium sp. 458]WJX99350.1 TetR/AcrR family transcriptional regulator C-terminal domain-containing protein [Curtobacterium sp. 458]